MGIKRGCIVRNRSLYALTLIFCTISALGQDQTIGLNGEGSFIAGPQGIPVSVLNEASSWSQPLVVFKNSKIELIIPDIRTTGWAQSYASAFKKEGNYFTYLYIYGVQSHRTIREGLYVNTRTRIAVVIENALTPPTRVDLCKPDPQMPIDRITAIVKNVSDSFHGQSLDDVIAEQSYAVARMAECSGLSNSQDCTLSDAEYRAKNPRYPRAKTPTEILLAQIAPMTARQPNDSCKGVPIAQNADSSPAPTTPPATSPTGTIMVMKQVGGGVKGPVIIYQPEPEFSEEARAAKFQGVVTVSIIVDQNGLPQNVHVTKGVGKGLDEKAMEAVRQYRFKPGTENGKPVATYLNVEVNFEVDPAAPVVVQTGEATASNLSMSTTQTSAGTVNVGTEAAFGTRFAFYVQHITQKVAAQWYPQMLDPQATGHRVYITFQVERDGSLTHIVLAQPSRDPTLDSNALNAVRHIDTFGPLPDAYSGSHINVTYYFDPPPHSAAPAVLQTEPAYPAPTTPPAISPSGSIMVQIAAVSSQDVADILLASLQKKGYSVSVRHGPQDNLLYVQIGPFATRQEAVAMQQRVLADGFNAIVK